MTELQKFLVSQKLLAADKTTGYFGFITETAVKKFQATQGIVSFGSPQTTGYGNIGPLTRAKINAMITASNGSQNTERIIEKIIPVIEITRKPATLDDFRFQNLESKIQELFSRNESQARQTAGISNTLSLTQRIKNLNDVTIVNSTVSGLSGLTDADIPNTITAVNYLPLTGGTLTGALTGTSLTLTGDLTVSGICTGCGAGSSFAWTPTANGNATSTTLIFNNGFISTASSTFSVRFNATYASTTALTVSGTASTTNQVFSAMTSGSVLFAGAGGLLSQNNSNLFWDNVNNRLGIGTTRPTEKLPILPALLITIIVWFVVVAI